MQRVSRALELSTSQLEALESGDFDAYLLGLDALEAACAAAAEARRTGAAGDDFARLIDINERIAGALSAARLETSERLAALNRARNGAGAYLASPAPVPFTVREA
jgi:hypothetical protein